MTRFAIVGRGLRLALGRTIIVRPRRKGDAVRGLVLLLFLLPLAIVPLADEIAIVPSVQCEQSQATTCLSAYNTCRGMRFVPEVPAGARIVASDQCFEKHAAECSACWPPIILDCRSFWGRLQVLGPWWIRLVPGAESWWKRLFGEGAKCSQRRAEIHGI
jgi:hypothetical protein